MATYSEMFPTGEGGYAHPDASLALTEAMRTADVLRSPAVYGYDPDDPFYVGVASAWDWVNYALATPERCGDKRCFNEAEQELTAVTQLPGATLANPLVMNARLLGAILPGFRARARRGIREGSITPKIIDIAQEGVGQVLVDFLDTPNPNPNDRLGRLCEIASMYILLCGRYFPFMGSPREEANRFWQDNHDQYVLEPAGRIPFSVKHVGPLEENPLVVTLRLGFIAYQAARRAGVKVAERGEVEALAATMAKHVRGERLEISEVAFLRGALRQIEGQMEEFRKKGYSKVDTELPSLARRTRRSPAG